MRIGMTITGDRELEDAFQRLADPSRAKVLIRAGVNRGLGILQRSVRGLIPPATSPRRNRKTGKKHNTRNIRMSIGRRFVRDAVTHLTAAKVGAAVGLKNPPAPHVNLYIGGTKPRHSGEKLVGRSSRVVKSSDTPSGKMRVRTPGRIQKTKHPRKFRGSVRPKDFVGRGVETAWPQALQQMRFSILAGVSREFARQSGGSG